MLGYSQNCFVVSNDLTGLDSELVILEQAACSLRDSLPSVFQSEFKVVHKGLYIHTPIMLGASQAFKSSTIQNASSISPYFLLIIYQLYPDGHSEYDIEIKLPDDWLSTCYDELVLNSFINSVKARFSALQND